jgi:hypothetical protein
MSKEKTVWYSVGDHECASRHPISAWPTADLSESGDAKLVAQDAAEDFHANHDGWEAVWPVVINLHEAEDGPSVCRLEVERESVPEFIAFLRPLATAK